MMSPTGAKRVEPFLQRDSTIDFEHHDDEQEQNHDGADVNEHQHDRQEFRFQPGSTGMHCTLEERQHQEHHGECTGLRDSDHAAGGAQAGPAQIRIEQDG